MNTPMLQDPTFATSMDRAGIAMPAGYLSALYRFLRLGFCKRLCESLNAVVWMHGAVSIAVENNGRDGWALRDSSAASDAALTHRGERRGHVGGGSVSKARM